MPVKIPLEPIDHTVPADMVIGSQDALPLFEGREDESLVCPGCGHEVTSGVSALTLHALFRPPARLLFHCRCDTYSAIEGSGSHVKN